MSVPYSVEQSTDLGMIHHAGRHRRPEFVQIVQDQVDQLYADVRRQGGRVMALTLHAFVSGRIQFGLGWRSTTTRCERRPSPVTARVLWLTYYFSDVL